MEMTETALTDEDRDILDGQMKQISTRLTVERLGDKIPAIAQLREINTELIRLLHHIRVVMVQRNTFTLQLTEDENGVPRNNFGQTEDEAMEDINSALYTLDITVSRWM